MRVTNLPLALALALTLHLTLHLALTPRCAQCLLWAFHRIVKFLTKFAFVTVATAGTPSRFGPNPNPNPNPYP